MGVASIFRKYSYAEIFVLRALYSRTNLRTRHWRVLDMQCKKINSNASAYSVWSNRTFCCIGYSRIIINAAILIFRSEANTAGSEWDRLPGFSAYQVFASWTHVYECSGCSPMQANACCESKQTTICENRGRRSHSLPDLYSFRPIIVIFFRQYRHVGAM